ncbi:AAA family ATPase [Candidiatus Paracoxiella cheracis]|uniref:AAA family ATPase n=1 Tax=Candidiatus Paracoxiella cheracis TaxID=3405120 RepID=UPI003BF59695
MLLVLKLSSHLNSVIGGRGTGKSTLIECLLYVLNVEPKGKEAKNQHTQIIKENLGKESARIEITLTSAQQNGKRYKVVRRYGELPRVIDDQGDESAMDPKDLLPGVEIYGQNEIYELAKDNTAILRVLERFMPKDEVRYDEEIKKIQKLLRENITELERIDLSPKLNTMTWMRFPIILRPRRSQPMRAMERRSRWRVFRGSRRFLTERSAEGTEFRRQRSEWQKSVGGVESSGDSAQSAARSRSAVDGDVRGYLGCRVLRVDY